MRTNLDTKKALRDPISDLLAGVGLRPTRQRVLLAKILFDGVPKHVTAEQVMNAARKRKGRVSLATIYNTLNHLTQAGLLREVSVNQSCSYFDTTLEPHHHFFDEVSGHLWDIPDGSLRLSALPKPPAGRRIARVDVTVRLTKAE